MDYYVLSLDKDYTDVPKTINWFGRIDVEAIYSGAYERLEKAYVLEIKENSDIYVTDIIIEPVFAVSKMVKTCLETFEPNIKYTRLYFVQRKEQKVFEYFIPHLTHEKCAVQRTNTIGHWAAKQKVCIDKRKIEPDKFIFYIKDNASYKVIVRTELLESIFRRDGKGIYIESVDIV